MCILEDMNTFDFRHAALNRTVSVEGNLKHALRELAEIEKIIREYPHIKHYIVTHHSLTADGETLSADNIYDNHRKKGYVDVGYDWIIEQIEHSAQVIVGRPMHMKGAHCPQKKMNDIGFGICWVGNFNTAPPPDMLWRAGVKHYTDLCRTFNIPPTNILGHRDCNNDRTCPGDKFDMDRLINDVTKNLIKEV